MSTTFTINGIAVTGPPGALAYKYADPIDDARWIFDPVELDELHESGAPLVIPGSTTDAD